MKSVFKNNYTGCFTCFYFSPVLFNNEKKYNSAGIIREL